MLSLSNNQMSPFVCVSVCCFSSGKRPELLFRCYKRYLNLDAFGFDIVRFIMNEKKWCRNSAKKTEINDTQRLTQSISEMPIYICRNKTTEISWGRKLKRERDLSIYQILEYFCINKIIAAGKCVYVIRVLKWAKKKERDSVRKRGTWSLLLHISVCQMAVWRSAAVLFHWRMNKCCYNWVYVEKFVNANLININCGSWCSRAAVR